MSPAGTIAPQMYLREARQRAGHTSLEAAAQHVPWSPQVIGRHERGDVKITPQDVVIYADKYCAPELFSGYCASCPVGERTGAAFTYQLCNAIVGLVNATGGQMENRRQ